MFSSSRPLISVVIGTYKRADDLDRAIASALAQPGDDFEVVVGDDGSQDHTPAVIRKHSADPRLRSYRNAANLGMQENMLKVVREGRGHFIFILTDDDYMVPGALETVRRVLAKYPDVGYVLSHLPTVDERTGGVVNLHRTFPTDRLTPPGLESVGQIAGSAWVLSRQILRRDWIDWETWEKYRANIFFPIIAAGRMLLRAPCVYVAEPMVMHTWFNAVHWQAFGPNELEIELNLATDRTRCMRAILHDQPPSPAVTAAIDHWELGNFQSYLYLSHRGFYDLMRTLGLKPALAKVRAGFDLTPGQRRELWLFPFKIPFVRAIVMAKAILRQLPAPVTDALKSLRGSG